MKNSRMIFAAVAVALTLGSVSVEAKSPMSNFNDKVKDFRKAYKDGTLTRRQKLAAAAAITAAAVLVLKGAGMGVERGGRAMQKDGMNKQQGTGVALETAGKRMQAPYDVTRRTIGKGAAETGKAAKGFGSRARKAGQAVADRYGAWRNQAQGPTS